MWNSRRGKLFWRAFFSLFMLRINFQLGFGDFSHSLFSNWIFLLYLLQPIKQFDKQQMIVIFFINAMIPLNHTRIQQKTDPTFQYGTRNLQIYKKKIVLSNRLLAWMCEAPSAVKRLSLQVWKLNFQKKKNAFSRKQI